MTRIRFTLPISLIIILIFTTACGSKTDTAPKPIQSSTQNSDQPASPVVTSTPAKIPAAPYSLAQLYDARVASGEWSAGEGLVQLLGMYTGSAKAGQVLGSAEVTDFELTGLIDLADRYLADNPSGTIRDEVLKQVNQLRVPLDTLASISVKSSRLDGNLLHFASLIKPSNRELPVADTITCQRLWETGFTSATAQCFQYDVTTVAGTEIKFYYPNWWAADDPRLVRIEPMFQAAELAVRKYNALGPNPLPPTTLVVTELQRIDPDTHLLRADVLAFTSWYTDPSLACYVGLFPGMFTRIDTAQDQQIVAHEMFHCYQAANLFNQSRGPEFPSTRWWVEGSAEFFSNYTYPNVNYEHQWLRQLNIAMVDGTSLTTWEYKANFFFQYLENRPDLGAPGILRLLQSMPTAHGSGNDAQLAALSAFPDMNNIFHQFVREVADQHVLDSDGSVIPLVIPVNSISITEPTAGGDTFATQAFAVDIRNIIYPEHFDYNLSSSIVGSPGMVSMRKSSTPQSWADVPSRVEANCGGANYLLVESQTGPSESNAYEVRMNTTSTPGTGQCSCLVGRWNMDNTSYLTHLNGLMLQAAPGLIKYTAIDGEMTAEFTSGGQVNQSIDALNILAEMSVTGLPIQNLVVAMDGTSTAGYTVTNNSITFTSVESHLTISTSLNGEALATGTPSDYLSSGPLGTGAGYVCSENTLTLTPTYPNYTNLPPLTFSKEP